MHKLAMQKESMLSLLLDVSYVRCEQSDQCAGED